MVWDQGPSHSGAAVRTETLLTGEHERFFLLILSEGMSSSSYSFAWRAADEYQRFVERGMSGLTDRCFY